MKKVVTIALCAVLLCLFTSVASASAFDLREYGQDTAVLTEPFSPLVDGQIDEDEYEIGIKAVLAEDEKNDEFFIYGDKSLTDAEHVTFYMAANDENIYFAVEQKDPLRIGHYDALYLQLGLAENTGDYIQIYFPYNAGLEILSEKDRAKWQDYYDAFAASYSKDITLYEIAIPREKIAEVFGVEAYDKLLVSLAHRVHYNAEDGHVVVTWGFQNTELGSSYTQQGFPVFGYPNVLELYSANENEALGELPELPAIVTSAPETEEKNPETKGDQTEGTDTEYGSEVKSDTDITEKGCGAALASSGVILVGVFLLGVPTLFVADHDTKSRFYR